MTSSFFNKSSASAIDKKPNSFDNISKVSSSATEPNAMLRKLMNSFCDFLPAPSAMLAGTDTAALLNYDVRPNRSSGGKFLVALYTAKTKSKLNNHASNFLCGLSDIGNVLPLKIAAAGYKVFHISLFTSNT